MSRLLFNISSFLISFPIAAINFKGFAVYYIFFIIALDTKIFSKILYDSIFKIKNSLVIFFLILVLYIIFSNLIIVNIFSLVFLIIKLIIFFYIILYFFYGFKSGYKLTGFYLGLSFFLLFQLIQLIEYNIFGNSLSLITNIHNWNFIKVGDVSLLFTQGTTHTSAAKDAMPSLMKFLLQDIKSVSSFAAEPSIGCFLILLCLFSVKNLIFKILLSISLLLMLSKTGFYLLLVIPFIYFSNRILNIKLNGFIINFSMIVILLFSSAYYFDDYFKKYLNNCMSYDYNSVNTTYNQTKIKSNYKYIDSQLSLKTDLCFFKFQNQSFTGRLLGSALFLNETNLMQKIFGVGFGKAKDINVSLEKPWSVKSQTYVNRHDKKVLYDPNKKIGDLYGGIQVLLLELGIIGLILYTCLINAFFKISKYNLCVYVIILYLTTFFYVTIFPFIMFFIAKTMYEARYDKIQ